jgi:hypothetical protein
MKAKAEESGENYFMSEESLWNPKRPMLSRRSSDSLYYEQPMSSKGPTCENNTLCSSLNLI